MRKVGHRQQHRPIGELKGKEKLGNRQQHWAKVVAWCGVVWCGVVWCGVVWRGLVWCGIDAAGVVWAERQIEAARAAAAKKGGSQHCP